MKTTPASTASSTVLPAGTTATVRRAKDRGRAEHGWLHARFTFSFAEYFDPDHMGFHALRVMNNDTIEPGGGFPPHPHRDMEIFTYVIEGELAHADSMGNSSTIKAGDLQYMSAGAGVRHSEFNPSKENKTELYQVWLHPSEPGGEPRYAEKPLAEKMQPDSLQLLFSGDGRDGSTAIRQDADIYFGRAGAGTALEVPASDRLAAVWLQVVEGGAEVAGHRLATGDGIALEGAGDAVTVLASEDSKFLVFRMA